MNAIGSFATLLATLITGIQPGFPPNVRTPSEKKEIKAPAPPHQYLQMLAKVDSAFNAQQASVREHSLHWLNEYECENGVACDEFFAAFDGALKANALILKKPDLASAEKLRDKIKSRMTRLKKELPPQNGLCAIDSARAGWLEVGYQLYCPTDGHLDKKALQSLIDLRSAQAALSSSYLKSFRHLGQEDCQRPWEAEIICRGGTNGSIDLGYRLRCERKGAAVQCEPSEKKDKSQ